MKLSKFARAKLKLSSTTERKSVVSSAKKLLDYGLITGKRAEMIARNFR
jgi:hypothetical protein